MHRRLLAFALQQFENGTVAVRKMLDLETLSGQLRDQFLDGVGFMQFDQTGAASQGAFLSLRLLGRFCVSVRTALGQLIVEKIQITVLLMKGTHFRLARKISDPLDISLTNLYEIRGQCTVVRVALAEVFFEVSSVSPDDIAELCKPLEQLEDILELER
jgi:hypothetical protein